jgi:hypothetical protein
MQYTCKSKFDLPKDAPAYLQEITNQIRKELKDVGTAVSTSTGSTVIFAASNDAGGGSTVITLSGATNIQAGTAVVLANTDKYVEFTRAFSTEPNVTFCAIAGDDGSFGLLNPSNLSITNEGFQIMANDVLQNGTVFYIAVVNI